jgi:hypothetical protein
MNYSLLDDSEQKYFTDFLDGLITNTVPIQDPLPNTVPVQHHLITNTIPESIHPLNTISIDQKGLNSLSMDQKGLRIKQEGVNTKDPLVSPITPTSTDDGSSKKSGAAKPRKRKKHLDDSIHEKPKRELLTLDEKRLNHVQSEQKRRKLIKDGFQMLIDSTPSLQQIPISTGPGNTGGGHSKSTILFKAGEYIKELQDEIQVLKCRLQMQEKMASGYQQPPPPSFVQVPPSFLTQEYYGFSNARDGRN